MADTAHIVDASDPRHWSPLVDMQFDDDNVNGGRARALNCLFWSEHYARIQAQDAALSDEARARYQDAADRFTREIDRLFLEDSADPSMLPDELFKAQANRKRLLQEIEILSMDDLLAEIAWREGAGASSKIDAGPYSAVRGNLNRIEVWDDCVRLFVLPPTTPVCLVREFVRAYQAGLKDGKICGANSVRAGIRKVLGL
jgi:hypothetical protein